MKHDKYIPILQKIVKLFLSNDQKVVNINMKINTYI